MWDERGRPSASIQCGDKTLYLWTGVRRRVLLSLATQRASAAIQASTIISATGAAHWVRRVTGALTSPTQRRRAAPSSTPQRRPPPCHTVRFCARGALGSLSLSFSRCCRAGGGGTQPPVDGCKTTLIVSANIARRCRERLGPGWLGTGLQERAAHAPRGGSAWHRGVHGSPHPWSVRGTHGVAAWLMSDACMFALAAESIPQKQAHNHGG